MKQAVPLLPVAYHGGAGFHAAEHGGAGSESDREGAAEPKCSRLTAAPIAPFPCAAGGEEVGGGGWGGKIFLSPYSESVLPITRTVE